MLTGYLVVCPNGLLLVHDVTANNHSVFIDEDGTIATFANGADIALRNTMSIIGIAELIAGLLLHVISHNALVGNGSPHIFMTIDIYNVRNSLDTHTTEGLLHVALEVLRLRMIDTIACRGLDEKCSFQRLLNADNVAVGQRRAVLRVALETMEGVTIVTIESCWSSQPDISSRVLHDAVDLTDGQTIAGIQRLK